MLRDGGAIAGRPVARRLTDWVVLGVVPAPIKHGLGRRRGSASGWSEFAYRFWLDMLRKRGQGEDIADLTNYVLALWTYGRVPLNEDQVKRALRTWASRRLQARAGHLSRSATVTIDRLIHPGASKSDRRNLVRLLARARSLEAPDQSIPMALRPVIAPGRAGRRGTSHRQSAEALSVEFIAQVIGAQRLAAIQWDDGVGPELKALQELVPATSNLEVQATGSLDPLRLGVCRDLAEGLGLNTMRRLGLLGSARV